MNLLASGVHGLAQVWYGMAGWFPPPLQVLSFVLVGWIGLRLALLHAVPAFARTALAPLHGLLRAIVWVLAAPEYALTSFHLRRGDRMPSGVHEYGEGLATLLVWAEKAVTAFLFWLQKAGRLPVQASAWGVAAVIFLVNASAYRNGQPLPLSLWWDSIELWTGS